MTVRLLKTFGGLSLAEADGSSALPEAAQRRLVLLALAVEAGDRGLPRDRATAFLWPEADDEHARRSLNQLRYTLRRELGADPLVGTLTLRPDPAVLASDLERFRAAVASGDVDAALALHAAPFLDGVALGGDVELDEWADSTRTQARRALSKLVEKAARDANTRGDSARSEFLWRRLVQLEPLAAPPVVGLMETLAARGDATGALVVASEHEATVQRELGVAPDASVRAAASQVRARTAAAVAASAVTPSAVAPSAVAPSAVAPSAVAPSAVAPSAPAARSSRSERRGGLVVFAAILAAIALVTFAARRNPSTPAAATNDRRRPPLRGPRRPRLPVPRRGHGHPPQRQARRHRRASPLRWTRRREPRAPGRGRHRRPRACRRHRRTARCRHLRIGRRDRGGGSSAAARGRLPARQS